MRRERLIAGGALVVGAIVAAGGLAWDYRSTPRLVTGPMVQMLDKNKFTIVWTMHPPTPTTVRLLADDTLVAEQSVSPISGLRYEVEFSDLAAGRAYTYEIHPVGYRQTVQTAPQDPRPFRILAMGDTGDGEWAQWRIARMLGAFRPDLIIHTGDVVYPRGRIEDYPRHFFQPYARLIDHVPFYPCLGNHDVRERDGSGLLETFVLPRNGPESVPAERVYWFDHAGARFVAIDSNLEFETLRDAVAPWLESVLAEAGTQWKIVFFHEPIYTHGRYPEAVKLRDSIGAVLDRGRVHLVLCGHNHMYERTHPLRDGQIMPSGQGTVYLTTGAGGANLYRLRPVPPAYLAAWDDTQHGFTIVDVSEDLMRVRQVGEDGRYVDDAHILRSGPTTQSGDELTIEPLNHRGIESAAEDGDAVREAHGVTGGDDPVLLDPVEGRW